MAYTVITGASSGIGYQAAIEFAKKGKDLILTARRIDRLESLKIQLERDFDVTVLIFKYDLSQPTEVFAFYEQLKNYPLETLINNAGMGNAEWIASQNLEKVHTMLQLNITALTILSTLFVHDYKDVVGAQLINVSSALGYTLLPKEIVYSATKHYVSAFTEGLVAELELTHAQLKAKILAPAFTETEFKQVADNLENFVYEGNVARYSTAEEIAKNLIDLYESNQVLGIIRVPDYKFELTSGQISVIR